LREIPGVDVIRHPRNQGIARGLNDGLDIALTLGATWLLTLDQDSLVDAEYLPTILKFANSINNQLWTDTPIGVVAPGKHQRLQWRDHLPHQGALSLTSRQSAYHRGSDAVRGVVECPST